MYINCKKKIYPPSLATRIKICAVFVLVNDEICSSVRLTGSSATSTIGRREHAHFHKRIVGGGQGDGGGVLTKLFRYEMLTRTKILSLNCCI